MKSGAHWGIVGGGVLGMTLALRLAEAGHRVTVLEASDSLGGLAAAWTLDTNPKIEWDKHYHVTLLSDLHVRKLLGELGLESGMRWVQTKTGFYDGSGLYPLSNSIDYLRLPALSFIDKMRLAGTIVYASRLKNWRKLEKISAVDWLTKLSGKRVVEKLWIPLLKAKLGENYKAASAAFIWSVIARLYAARRTGLKKEMFGYVPGGYAHILLAFEAELERRGVEIRRGSAVTRATRTALGITLTTKSGASLAFDKVVFTAPAPVVAAACPDLSAAEKSKLNAVSYQGIICASLILKKPLAGNYLTYITDRTIPFTAVVEMSALVDPAEFNGHSLVYLPLYVDPQDPAFERTDADLRREFLAALARMYPGFSEADVLAFQVSRVRRVFALPTLEYSSIAPSMETSIPDIFVVNSAQIVNGTLNVNETVQLAERAAAELKNAVPAPRVRPEPVEGEEPVWRIA